MDQKLIATILAIHAITQEAYNTLDHEPLTQTGNMYLDVNPQETELENLKRNNKAYKSFISHAHETMSRIEAQLNIINSIIDDVKVQYEDKINF